MRIVNLNGDVTLTDPENDLEEDLPFSKATFGREIVDRDPHKITDMKPAVRDKNRVNIFLGSVFAFSLDISQVVDFHLSVGKTLTDKEIKELESASEFGKLYNSTLEWVFTRPHSIKETRDHLEQKLIRRRLDNKRRRENAERMKVDPEFAAKREDLKIQTKERKLFSEEDIEKVISRLIEKKYLDDHKFAQWYIENRFVKKGISRRRLADELAKKGIDRSIISELLSSSERTDVEEIKKVIKKKGTRLDSSKLLRKLVSMGFPYELSRSLLEDYKSDPEGFFADSDF